MSPQTVPTQRNPGRAVAPTEKVLLQWDGDNAYIEWQGERIYVDASVLGRRPIAPDSGPKSRARSR